MSLGVLGGLLRRLPRSSKVPSVEKTLRGRSKKSYADRFIRHTGAQAAVQLCWAAADRVGKQSGKIFVHPAEPCKTIDKTRVKAHMSPNIVKNTILDGFKTADAICENLENQIGNWISCSGSIWEARKCPKSTSSEGQQTSPKNSDGRPGETRGTTRRRLLPGVPTSK